MHRIAIVAALSLCATSARCEEQKDFVAVSQKVDAVMQPKQPTDAIRECAKDAVCGTVIKAAATYVGIPSQLVSAAIAIIPPPQHTGEESRYSISLPSGYQYCRSTTHTVSVVPATGDRASYMSIGSQREGLGIYTWTPRQGLGAGRSWMEADVVMIGVKDELAEKYRASGKCKPFPKTIAACRGARGVNHGQPACGIIDD